MYMMKMPSYVVSLNCDCIVYVRRYSGEGNGPQGRYSSHRSARRAQLCSGAQAPSHSGRRPAACSSAEPRLSIVPGPSRVFLQKILQQPPHVQWPQRQVDILIIIKSQVGHVLS